MAQCSHCNKTYEPPVYRNSVCSGCGRELKICRNCRHFAPGMANDCREPVSEPVINKDRANFCDWFSPAETIAGASHGSVNKSADAKKAFDALFDDN